MSSTTPPTPAVTASPLSRINDAEELVAMLHSNLVATLPPRSEQTRQAALARTEFEGAFMRLRRAVMPTSTPWSA